MTFKVSLLAKKHLSKISNSEFKEFTISVTLLSETYKALSRAYSVYCNHLLEFTMAFILKINNIEPFGSEYIIHFNVEIEL